jgi:hypothetical protein
VVKQSYSSEDRLCRKAGPMSSERASDKCMHEADRCVSHGARGIIIPSIAN